MDERQSSPLLSLRQCAACAAVLREKKLSIAFAESASAGAVMAAFSMLEDAGDFLKGGIVCYDLSIKEGLLKVPSDLLERFTAESAEATRAAAEGLRQLIDADVHVAITGLTRSGGSETPRKPVGTLFFHFLWAGQQESHRCYFRGDAEEILSQAINSLAVSLKAFLSR